MSSSWSLSPFTGGTEFLELVRIGVCMCSPCVCVCVRIALLLGIERNISADATPGLGGFDDPGSDDYTRFSPSLRRTQPPPCPTCCLFIFLSHFFPLPRALCLIFSVPRFCYCCHNNTLLLLLYYFMLHAHRTARTETDENPESDTFRHITHIIR